MFYSNFMLIEIKAMNSDENTQRRCVANYVYIVIKMNRLSCLSQIFVSRNSRGMSLLRTYLVVQVFFCVCLFGKCILKKRDRCCREGEEIGMNKINLKVKWYI